MDTISNKYIRSSEAARLLGVTSATICNWVASGKLKGIKVGNGVRVERASLDAYVNKVMADCFPVVEDHGDFIAIKLNGKAISDAISELEEGAQ